MKIPGLILLEGQKLTHPDLKDLKAGAKLSDHWSSISDDEVISVDSKEDDYVPRSPEYIPDLPGPVETEDQNPNNNESGPSRRTGFSTDNEERPRILWAEETSCRGFPPF